jgi:hypothetical protein
MLAKASKQGNYLAAGLQNHILERNSEVVINWLIIGAFVASLSWAILMAGVGWNNTLSDQHGFRQTQTAITTYYLMQGGPLLNYETPVLGRPWSVPFEFPLYQWIVASAAILLKSPLNETGRFVSELFFFLSLVMIWLLLAALNVRMVYRLVFLTLILVSPQYVFWSRTFMIESIALFLCMTYLLLACRYARDHTLLTLFFGGVTGALAALVKATTLPAFVLVAGLFYFFILQGQYKAIKVILPKTIVPFLFFVCLPLLALLFWTQYADQVKSLNVVGIRTTSSALMDWNFGSLAQRLSPHTWTLLFTRTIPDLIGGNISLVLSLIALCLARNRLIPFFICIVAFLSVFLIFTNLHVVHNYYAYANGIFLVGASSYSAVGLLEEKKWKGLIGVLIFVVMILVSVKGYYERYYEVQRNNASDLYDVSHAIQNITLSEEIILVFGQDWSSELPYYSKRRALMWPAWMPQDIDSPEMKEALRRLGDTRVGALVVCNGARADSRLIKKATDALKVAVMPKYQDRMCAVFSARAS